MLRLTLNNGVEMPALGFGVFQTPPDETASRAGSTRLRLSPSTPPRPTATSARSARRSANSGLDRSEVFLETKIWISDYGYDETLHGFDKSAGKLGVDQIDLLILHQALPTAFDRPWRPTALSRPCSADGQVRAIGVSNFMVEHLTTLLDVATVVPAVNQIECHPYFAQPDGPGVRRRARHRHTGLVTVGGITFYRDGKHAQHSEDPVIGGIATAHGKTPAQVMLRRACTRAAR